MASNEQDVVSMIDVLQEDHELEEEAAAVLGDSDDKCCTYLMGYVKRQALYACMTCRSSSGQPGGICLACSYECHEGHEFVELYTKRDFRCDCGNDKFLNLTCKLIPDKVAVNSENGYNHNFEGLYCTCNRPYPDPEDDVEDEMIQCIICEDWFHGRHLGVTTVPENDDYQEMICQACMQRCDFLWSYTVHSTETKLVLEEKATEVDVTSQEPSHSSDEPKEISISVHTKHSDEKCTSQETPDIEPSSSAAEPSILPPGPSGDGKPPDHEEDRKEKNENHSQKEESVVPKKKCEGDAGSSSQEHRVDENPCVDAKSSVTTKPVDSEKSDSTSSSHTTNLDHATTSSKATNSGSSIKSNTTESGNTSATQHIAASSEGVTDTPAKSSDVSPSLESETKSDTATTSSTVPIPKTEDDRVVNATESKQGQRSKSTNAADSCDKDKEDITRCRLKELSTRKIIKTDGAIFWPLGWRTKLCTCKECQAMYDRLDLGFLLDEGDSVGAYEERGKIKRRGSQYEQGMEALSQMNRVQQVEMMHGYQNMKSALSDFLKSFADEGKVVTATDIQEFYDTLNRKRQRVGSAGTVQYLCR